MSPKTLGDGGRGLGWQHLVNSFLNPFLVKQNLNLFLIFLLSKWYIVSENVCGHHIHSNLDYAKIPEIMALYT